MFRFLGLWGGLQAAIVLPFLLGSEVPAIMMVEAELSLLAVHVNPQGRGDYNLHPDALPG